MKITFICRGSNFHCTSENFTIDVVRFSVINLSSGSRIYFYTSSSPKRYSVPCFYFYSDFEDGHFVLEIDDVDTYKSLYNSIIDEI